MISSNAEEVIKNVDKFVKVVSQNTTEALDEVGLRGVARVKNNSPVVTGRLKNSMAYTVDGKVKKGKGSPKDTIKKSRDKKAVIIGTNVEYAQKVEYLSRNVSKGFMLRSFKELKPIADKVFKEVLKKVTK